MSTLTYSESFKKSETMSAQPHLKLSGFYRLSFSMCNTWWGNLTPEFIVSLYYYFVDDCVTVGMYCSVFAIVEKKQKF